MSMTVTTQPTGHEHSYVLVDGEWVGTVKNEFAEAVKEAIAAVANRSHDQEELT